jgi:hypothetical protein
MSINYFRPRDRFDFAKDTLDIGNPITWNRSHFLKHFFKRVFAISEQRIEQFYQRHIAYYLENHPDGSEELFLRNLWELIERQLKVLMRKDIYDKDHIRNEREIRQLKKFTEILISHDRWNFHKSNGAVVAQQELEIYALKQEIIQLKAGLKKATLLEKDGYINIRAGRAHSLYDIIHQLQEIRLPDGFELLYPADQIIWRRIICKFFREDHEEINFNTIHRYFPTDKKNPGSKYKEIAEKDKLFKINLARKRS